MVGVVESQACWHSPIIAALQEADAGDHKFKPGLQTEVRVCPGNLVRPCLKVQK